MLPSIDSAAIHSPPCHVDNGASLRISARNRARNREATAEFEASFEKVSKGLKAWEAALKRNSQFLEAFEEIR